MFNRQRNSRYFLGVLIGIGFVVMAGQVFATDDSDFNLIADMLHTYIGKREQNDYLEKSYTPKFQQDPFGAVVEDLQGQSTEVVLGGIQEVTTQLQKRGCGITQRNLIAILYYFGEEFRSEMERQLGLKSNQAFNQKPDKAATEKACLTLNVCLYPNAKDFNGDVMTDCRDKVL